MEFGQSGKADEAKSTTDPSECDFRANTGLDKPPC